MLAFLRETSRKLRAMRAPVSDFCNMKMERTFDLASVTVNVVSTFLMALLFLPILQETGRKFNITPNLTIVSSEVHFVTPVRILSTKDDH